MIFGIGVDIVRVERIAQAQQNHGDRFAEKILSKNEYQDYLAGNKTANFLAKRFAAKEAFSKALGTGIRNGITLKQIGITHNELGRPVLQLSGVAKKKSDLFHISDYHISLSDERDHVIAFVTLEVRHPHD